MNTEKYRILITNDDGYASEGIKLLHDTAKVFSDDVTIIAPADEQSGKSQALTLSNIIRLNNIKDKEYTISGTPADCVMVALRKIMFDKKPTLILSGVNRGQNLGDDLNYSGTVGSAMEGAMHNIKSIAFSQVFNIHNPGIYSFAPAKKNIEAVIDRLLNTKYNNNIVMNVNFPDISESNLDISYTFQGKRDAPAHLLEERTDPRGNTYYWVGFKRGEGGTLEGSDLKAIHDGKISITPVQPNRTDYNILSKIS